MAISKQSLKVTPDGWAVNATSSDASGGEEFEAAPGTAKTLVLQEIAFNTSSAVSVIVDSRASATATVTRMLGPIAVAAETLAYEKQFIRGIRANTNEALYITTSASATVNLYAGGVIL